MTDQRPRCRKCSRPLFRSAERGTVVPKGTPYAVCRNADCSSNRLHRVKPEKIKRKKGLLVPPEEPVIPAGFITKQRQRVREFVTHVSAGEEPMSVALLLALACEETNNPEAAAIIASKHRLDLLGYGLTT